MNSKLRQAYASQKFCARRRGIDFLLTREEWLKIWIDSGNLPKRGRGAGKYCMARYGDIGSYSVDNVRIILNKANHSEQAHPVGWTHLEHSKELMSQAHSGKQLSLSTRQKMREFRTGRKWSEEVRNKMSATAKKRSRDAGGCFV